MWYILFSKASKFVFNTFQVTGELITNAKFRFHDPAIRR